MIPSRQRNSSASYLAALAVGAALVSLSACNRAEEAPAPQASAPATQSAPQADPFRVTGVALGNAIGADKKVLAPSDSFKPSETIYASVLSQGASPNVSLAARWTFEDGQLVSEATQNIAPAGPAVTEFHISKPDGWPAGKYKFEVSANGTPAGTAQFTVTE